MRPIKKNSTDQSVVIRIIDSTAGTPETGVEHDTSGIDLWYRREGATKTSITEAALAALDSAHSDGGIEHIGDGYYRLDLPDAAVATGANGVMVGGAVTGMIVIGCYVPLVDYDPYDSVRAGLTALPNAAADAAGGLPISDAGGLDLDAIKAVTDAIPDSGALTALLASIASILEDTGTTLPASIAGLNNISAAQVNAEVVDALGTDTIAELAADPGATPTMRTALMLFYMALRNKLDITSTAKEIHNDAGAVILTKTLSDDGTTYSESKVA